MRFLHRGSTLSFAWFLWVAIAGLSVPAKADDSVDDGESIPFARVIVDRIELRSGPGSAFQTVYVAERGETFPVRSRSTRAYWLQVELPDGTMGWVLGSAVYTHELGDGEGDGRFLPGIFAPPPLPTATGELSVTAGLLGKTFGADGGGGFMALRPALYVAPTFGVELTAAASVAEGGRIFLLGGGPIVNIFPRSPIVPYVVVGGGAAMADPNADTFLLESGTTAFLYGGGGLRFGFRYR
ncbi:MAG: SH3 domain-containing protein, partial [Myxococcales bacterium]|nr:SH3 domain-containing protein [Myxococcales bacterium]